MNAEGRRFYPAALSFLLLAGLACGSTEKPLTPTPTSTPLPTPTAFIFEPAVSLEDSIDMDSESDRKKFCGGNSSEIYYESTQVIVLKNNSIIRLGVKDREEGTVYYRDRYRSSTVVWGNGEVKTLPFCGNQEIAVKRVGDDFIVGVSGN